MSEYLFTSESVTEGHPDKIADQISDGVLDAMLAQDPMSRVACETLITTGQVMVAGEVTTTAQVDIPGIVRETVARIGYVNSRDGFDAYSCGVSVALDRQSPDIAQGVDTAFEKRAHGDEDRYDEQGAGDQGLMFGFACDETPVLMPLPIVLAHRIAERLAAMRRSTMPFLLPDGKSQVSVRYDGTTPVGVDAVGCPVSTSRTSRRSSCTRRSSAMSCGRCSTTSASGTTTSRSSSTRPGASSWAAPWVTAG